MLEYYGYKHVKYESSGPCISEIFFLFSHGKSMGANDPQSRAFLDPRGMVGRIYKEEHYTLLHTKYESSRPCGFGDFFIVFPMKNPRCGLYRPQGHGWQDL